MTRFFHVCRQIYGSQPISGERVQELSDLKALCQSLAVYSITSLAVHLIRRTANRRMLIREDVLDDAGNIAYECYNIIVSEVDTDDNRRDLN